MLISFTNTVILNFFTKKHHWFCFLIVFMLFQGKSYGQVSANFVANQTSGCAPLSSVQFTDMSSGNITSRTWYFGEGSPIIGNDSITFHSYSVPGNYDVELIVSDGINKDTLRLNNFINVFPNPVSNFSMDTTKGCEPLQVVFYNQSVVNAGISNRIWKFGDGNTFTGSDTVSYTYTNPGNFTPCLEVTDSNGCGGPSFGNTCFADTIKVEEIPTASFSNSIAIACTQPLLVNFSNTSLGMHNTFFEWNFGDASTSSLENPNHNYTSDGLYDVSLTVSTPLGCTSTLTEADLIQLGNISASFALLSDTICSGNMSTFIATTPSGFQNHWLINGDSVYAGNILNHLFDDTVIGFQYITLISSINIGCADTITDSVYINNFNVSIQYNINYPCNMDPVVNYSPLTNLTPSDIANYYWGFSDASTSNTANNILSYNGILQLNDTLRISDVLGCTKTFISDTLLNPLNLNVEILFSDSFGCAPLNTLFTGSLQGDTSLVDSIVSWFWDFNNPALSPNDTASGRYTNASFDIGTYNVSLTTQDNRGCLHTATQEIFVGLDVTSLIEVLEDTICAEDLAVFKSASPDSLILDHWFWEFGDPSTGQGAMVSRLLKDTGWISASLVVFNNGCSDTAYLDSAIYVQGPYFEFSIINNCDSTDKVMFDVDPNMGIQRFYWDFGDGSPLDSVTINPTHNYSLNGSYNAVLLAYNDSNQCQMTKNKDVYITTVQSAFTTDSFACLGETILLDASASTDLNQAYWAYNYTNDSSFVQGTIIDNATLSSSPLHTIGLIAKDVNNCTDTSFFSVSLYHIQAMPYSNFTSGCIPIEVQFSDSSTSDNPIASWVWSFDDNDSSFLQNPTHTYATIGLYDVSLSITDTAGCNSTSEIAQTLTFLKPIPGIELLHDTNIFCLGESINFLNTSQNFVGNGMSYVWDFGDGSTNNSQTHPSHSYQDTGWYTVSLTATDTILGCDSSITNMQYLYIQNYPTAGFMANPIFSGCYPTTVSFTDTSISPYINAWSWNFGDNSAGSNTQNPSKDYVYFGTYDVQLIVSTSAGCKDTAKIMDYIDIQGPFVSFSVNPDTICINETLEIKIDSVYNVSNYSLDIGDASPLITGSAADTFNVSLNQTGLFFQTITFESGAGCIKSKRDSVFIKPVRAAFTIFDTLLCIETASASFSNQSLGGHLLDWRFGDGSSAQNFPNLVHTYDSLGTYTIKLAIEDTIYQCIDSINHTLRIKTLENLIMTPDTLLCAGDEFKPFATATMASEYLWWSDSASISDTSISSPLVTGNDGFLIAVKITDLDGCSGSDTSLVRIQSDFSSNVLRPIGGDTSIAIGDYAYYQFEIESQDSLHWEWIAGESHLSCPTCLKDSLHPLESIILQLSIQDTNGCFIKVETANIEVRPETSASVPTAFTPDGDGNNDIIYVRGWGIEQLIEYKIYNRWGELVYENPGDLAQGWDGSYKGKIQESDTYAVKVIAIDYLGNELSYKGHINLLK